jgi:N-methylhydantoinase B
MASGHLFDQTIVTPVFYKGKGIGWFASTCHAMDIGGLTMGGDATEVFEEGLAIPMMKLFKAGEPNEDLFNIIRANVRVPSEVIGDLYAQQAGNMVGSRKLIEMMDEYKLETLDELADLILDRTEKSLRDAIEKIQSGTYQSAVMIDGFDDPVTIQCKVIINERDIVVDFDGTSPQIKRGINVVMNYTHAYTTYTLMCAIAPDIPNNEGAFRPITVKAPEGSILNCRRPAPVSARHLIGHFVSQPILNALSNPIPNNVIADGSAGLWNTMFEGELNHEGDVFAYIYFSAGGMGARPYRDGLSATAFPSGITGVPAEVIESVAPIRMHKRELLTDSGGAGKFRGGLGQEMILEVLTGLPAIHSCMYDRTKFSANGFHGGQAGTLGDVIRSDGVHPHPKSRYVIQPLQTVTLRLPGGGGFYSPLERDPASVLEDVRQGYVSVASAKEKYGVVIEEGIVDEERTREERRKMK